MLKQIKGQLNLRYGHVFGFQWPEWKLTSIRFCDTSFSSSLQYHSCQGCAQVIHIKYTSVVSNEVWE